MTVLSAVVTLMHGFLDSPGRVEALTADETRSRPVELCREVMWCQKNELGPQIIESGASL